MECVAWPHPASWGRWGQIQANPLSNFKTSGRLRRLRVTKRSSPLHSGVCQRTPETLAEGASGQMEAEKAQGPAETSRSWGKDTGSEKH